MSERLQLVILAFDHFLTDISRCFLQRDLNLWLSRLILPFSIITRHGLVELSDEKAVAENFSLYLKACDAISLDMIDRTIISLDNCGDGSYLGVYETRLLSRGELATDPYQSTVILKLMNNQFRMMSMMNGRGHAEWTGVTDR